MLDKFNNTYPKYKFIFLTQIRKYCKKLAAIFPTDLCWILLIGGAFRLLYYLLLENTQTPDSPTYLNYSFNIFKGQIDGFRTPVYPYFIECIRLLSKKNLIRNIVFAQSAISFATIFIFFKIACFSFKSRKVINASTLLYALMLPLINYDVMIITESLSIGCIVFLTMIMLGYLKKQTILKAIFITMYAFFAIMLRPAFIILIPVIVLFWLLRLAFYKKERKICLFGLATSILVILLIHGYSSLNKKENGFYGISTVTNINQLDLIISSNMYMNGDDTALSNIIRADFSKPLTADEHWYPLMHIIHNNPPKRIADFIANCIKHQPDIFIKRIFKTFNALQTSNIFINYAQPKQGFLPRLIMDIEAALFFVTFNKVVIFLLFDFIVIIVSWLRTKQPPWINIILWLLIVSQISVAIIGAQSEYQRLIVATIPCLIILLFLYIDKICCAIDKTRLKNYPAFN